MKSCSLIKKISITVTLMFIASLGFTQRDWPSELWHEGRIVLVEGDTLSGLLKYDFQQDLVQYTKNNRKAEIYTARKVLFFEIFDETVHKYRKFFVLPYSKPPSNYRAPVFFELLEEGKMTLLSRELLEYKTYNNAFYGGSYSRLVQVDDFYFLKEDVSIEDFRGNKNDLLAMMGSRSKAVEKYIKANRLDFEEKYDVAQIVAYYNSLSGS